MLEFTMAFMQANAQVERTPGTRFVNDIEVAGGPSWSVMRDNYYTRNSPVIQGMVKRGFSVSLSANHNLSRRLSLEFIGLFERKGILADELVTIIPGVYSTSTVEYTYDYVGVPVIINYSPDAEKRLSFGLGVFSSYLIKETETRKIPYYRNINTIDETESNLRWDAGAVAQVKYEFRIKNRRFFVRLIDTRGFVNTKLDTFPDQSFKTNNFSVVVGIKIPFTGAY